MLGLPEWAYSVPILVLCVILALSGWDDHTRGE